jgi:sugar/nucleoside kinase (ribokinase family)
LPEKSNVYDIAIIGNYTKDTIVSAAGTRQVDGGGFNYGAYVAAMMRLDVAAVTRLAENDNHVVERLQRLGVDVYAFTTPQSTCMRLEYPSSDVDERILTVTSTAGSFTPAQVEPLQARTFLINASIRGEVDPEVIAILRTKKSLLAADVQGFVRTVSHRGRLVYDAWPEKEQVLSQIDILKTDAVEAEMLTGEKDIRKAARLLSGSGPKEIVLTHRDGLLVYACDKFYEAGFFPEKLIGRSGRGDTCIAAYASKRLSADPGEATIWAAAVTSLKMEAEGPIRREVSDVAALINKNY